MSSKKIRIKDDEIVEWQQRIDAAEKRLEENLLPRWKQVLGDYVAEYEHDELGLTGDEGVNFNFLLATANVLVPNIISAEPYVRFLPRRPGDEDSARLAESAVNYVFREIDVKSVLQDVVLDGLMFNFGLAKVGYDPSGAFLLDEEYETGPEHVDAEEEEGLDEFEARELRRIMAEEDIPFDEGPQDNPTIERVPPWNLLTPPGYSDIQKCPWVAERLTVRIDDLEMDDRFRLPKGLEPDAWLSETLPNGYSGTAHDRMHEYDKEPEFVTVYELRYWAKTKTGLRRRIMWLTKGQDFLKPQECVIRHINDPLNTRGYPYRSISFTRIPGRMHSTQVSDLAAIRDISARLNQEWSQLLRHHSISSKRKWVGLPGILEDGSLSALLTSDADMEVAEIPANVGDIRNAIMLLPEAPPPSTTVSVMQGLQRLMYEISGVDVYQRGGVGRKGTTATEVAIAAQGSSNRAAIRLGTVERFIENVGRLVLSIIRQYWDEPRYLRVSGPTGNNEFVTLNPGDISGMYDVRVEAGSTIGKDPGTEQQAFMGLLNTINSTVNSLIPLVQAGISSPDTITNFVDRAFSIWQQDKRMLMEPLAALQAASTPAAAGGGGGGAGPVGPESVQGRGMGADGQPLAGPPTTSGTGGTADVATLMSRLRG
tara:strand:+ start:8758 stop:10716 length:1959 start_codon:yes stop_codon:yes gene_type:complete